MRLKNAPGCIFTRMQALSKSKAPSGPLRESWGFDMAGEWIKMRADLFTHPKVVRIASALKADTLRTVGGLMSVWCLFDAHSESGHLDGYSPQVLDSHLRWEGFADAMMSVGWLHYEAEKGLDLPRFDAHNGQSSKRRVMDSERKRSVRKMSANDADKKRTREEKRREDINHTNSDAAERRFDAFWIAYPKKVGKDAASKAFKKRKVDGELFGKMLDAIEKQKQTPAWTKDAGQFIPNPATWLNQGRWMDQSDDDGAAYNPLLSGGI
jgi:hypothetical protein